MNQPAETKTERKSLSDVVIGGLFMGVFVPTALAGIYSIPVVDKYLSIDRLKGASFLEKLTDESSLYIGLGAVTVSVAIDVGRNYLSARRAEKIEGFEDDFD